MPRAEGADVEQLADDATEHLENGDFEQALEVARRGVRLARRAGDVVTGTELTLVEGLALANLGRAAEAIASFDAVLAACPDDVEAQLERGLALFETCRLDESRRQLS